MALATFTTYLLTDEKNVLDSKTAFVSIALFNTLYLPLTRISFVVTGIIQTSVAVKRLNAFMNSDELDPQNVTHDESESKFESFSVFQVQNFLNNSASQVLH